MKIVKKILSIVKNIVFEIVNIRNITKIQKSKKFKKDRLAAELIRNTHSIEKGLCIEKPRLGFGHAKQEEMMQIIDELKTCNSNYYSEAIKMGMDSLQEYINFHKHQNFSDEYIEKIEKYLEDNNILFITKKDKFGGTIDIKSKDMNFRVEEIEKFFKTRHSIRDFDTTEIDNEKLKKAIELAQTAPSACNRQGVRIYVIGKEKIKNMSDWLEGIGGFENSVQKYILITGKISSYREAERYQYIVSSSMYAAYLTLTLHLYGFGACVIQRPVVYSKKWNKLRGMWSIPEDEQIICLLSVGNLKENYKVPISHRLKSEEIIKFLE